MKETKQAVITAQKPLDAVMHYFEQFKTANDERLSAIEKKQADPLNEQKVDRLLQALEGAEERFRAHNHKSDRPEIKGMFEAPLQKNMSGWEQYLRHGYEGREVKNGLSLTSGAGLLAPAQTANYIDKRLAQVSPMRSLASIQIIGAGSFNKPVSTAQLSAGWVADAADRPETNPPTLDTLNFPLGELYANPALTQDLLDDAFINLDEWLASEIEDSFAAQETDAFVNGNGTNRPKGFLNYTQTAQASVTWGQVGFVATGTAGNFNATNPADALIDLIYAPGAGYRPNAHFVMNRRTASRIRKFKDSDGNYIWQPAQSADRLPILLGYPVIEMEPMPDIAAGSASIAFGDFAKAYLIVDRAGINILKDPYSAKPYVRFYTTKRVGGGLQNFEAIKLLKFQA